MYNRAEPRPPPAACVPGKVYRSTGMFDMYISRGICRSHISLSGCAVLVVPSTSVRIFYRQIYVVDRILNFLYPGTFVTLFSVGAVGTVYGIVSVIRVRSFPNISSPALALTIVLT